jgi:hypothetical protein
LRFQKRFAGQLASFQYRAWSVRGIELTRFGVKLPALARTGGWRASSKMTPLQPWFFKPTRSAPRKLIGFAEGVAK